MTDKLKPCPFCGGEAGLNEVEDGYGGLSGAYVVCLNVCNVQATPITWNTRADDWQPIETAPKDGSTVIVEGGTAYWHNGYAAWFSHSAQRPIEWPVTRWKPLPEPPEQGEE